MEAKLIMAATPTCFICSKWDRILVDSAGYERWKKEQLIQDAFPEMDRGKREQLLTGTHPACWDTIFAEDEDEV